MRKSPLTLLLPTLLLPTLLLAQSREIVQIDQNGNTIPANSIATPTQISSLSSKAESSYTIATNVRARVEQCEAKVKNLSTNLVVTSTVYVQSVGGIPYDPSLQTLVIRAMDFVNNGADIEIVATVAQTPLVVPTVDWRIQLTGESEWENVQATVLEVPIPAGVDPSTVAKAYSFTFPKPPNSSSFFRIVDNSTGASGSGLYWLVYGAIWVDGMEGYTGMIGEHRSQGGILVNSTPLGGL